MEGGGVRETGERRAGGPEVFFFRAAPRWKKKNKYAPRTHLHGADQGGRRARAQAHDLRRRQVACEVWVGG